MKKKLFLLLGYLIIALSVISQTVTCYTSNEATTSNFWLDHYYYATCTDYVGAGSKLAGNGTHIDFNGGSSVIFNNIVVSHTGQYTFCLTYGIGYAGASGAQFKAFLNETEITTYTVSTAGDLNIKVTLQGGVNNTLRLQQIVDWPTIFGFQLISDPICYDQAEVTSSNFWLNYYYFATCTDYTGAGSKLASSGTHIDFNSGSSVVFDNIYVSRGGEYIFRLDYGVGYAGSQGAQFNVFANDEYVDTYTVFSAGTIDVKVILKAGKNNKIRIQQFRDWPTIGGGKLIENRECYTSTQSSKSDFWLNHFYYATCTDYAGTGSKLTADGLYVDFNGGSSVTFNNIYVSETSDYTVKLNYGIGYTDANGAQFKVYVNGNYTQTYTVYNLTQTAPAIIEFNVRLQADANNNIRIEQVKDWPTIYGIELDKTVTSYSTTESSVADFWLNHFYYACFTDYIGNGSKLAGSGPYVDFNGESYINFNNIYVSQTGEYTVRLSYGIGYADENGADFKLYVNNNLIDTYTIQALTRPAPGIIEINVTLQAGTNNSIKLQQSRHWPTVLGIRLNKQKTALSTLQSGNLRLNVVSESDGKYSLNFIYNNNEYKTLENSYPVYLEINNKKLVGRYNSYSLSGNTLECIANIQTDNSSTLKVTDKYISIGNGDIDLERKVQILSVAAGDNYFNSFVGFQASYGSLTDNDYFIPSVWYKGNFEEAGNLPSHLPQKGDLDFLYREDRIPLPLVMVRNKNTGSAVTIIHKESPNTTVMADNDDMLSNSNYQYGSLGVRQSDNTIYQTFVYPGSEKTTVSRRGHRSHPMQTSISHEYKLRLSFVSTANYGSAVKNSWEKAFAIYQPTIHPVNLSSTYDGLIETLLTYYIPSNAQGGNRDAPGFPFEVSLTDFQPKGINYQMGFVGMQLPSGYYLFRDGIERSDSSEKEKGEAILNFWTSNSLSSLGYPRTWYDPGLNGNTGSFRSGSDIRVCTGGMEGLLAAWCFAKKNNIDRPAWIDACTRFGNWLVANQNADGSFYFSYDHNTISGGKHPATNTNKYLTICAVRYLVELYLATGNESYQTAALNAGEFCLQNIHNNFYYVACVVDNPQTIDSESGQMALNGFLSLYDLTKGAKWLAAAEQAATYAESWVYSYEIPVETNRTTTTSFPANRSITGQHIIAIGHGGADLGFAWSSFAFYRLYLETGNEHYLHIARMSAHNTKQSMNWDGSLYPGQPKGLQLEAFPVSLPRRTDGVMTALNWNYAAHLDPMFRFKDAFGTPDMEAVETMSYSDRIQLNAAYSLVQSSNYGQNTTRSNFISGIENEDFLSDANVYPNPVEQGGVLYINIPDNYTNIQAEIYDISGNIRYKAILDGNIALPHSITAGYYILQLKGENVNIAKRILVK